MEQDDQLLAQEIRAHYFPGETGSMCLMTKTRPVFLHEIHALYFSRVLNFVLRGWRDQLLDICHDWNQLHLSRLCWLLRLHHVVSFVIFSKIFHQV